MKSVPFHRLLTKSIGQGSSQSMLNFDNANTSNRPKNDEIVKSIRADAYLGHQNRLVIGTTTSEAENNL